MAQNDLRQAKRLIRECFETQNSYLDLGNCGITDLGELPELFECTHLETLILSNEWRDYEKREWIKSQNVGLKNKLEKITLEIEKLAKLKVFKIGGEWHNKFQISDIHFLEKLSSIKNAGRCAAAR